MLKIETNRGVLDLRGDLSLQVEEKSPVMNERGSQSLPVTLPPTPRNMLLTGFAHRLDGATAPMSGDKSCVVSDGVYWRRGILNLVSASRRDGVTLNVGFDNSEAYEAWKKRKLNEVTNAFIGDGTVGTLKSLMQAAYTAGDGGDYAVFPIAVEREEISGNSGNTIYWGVLNRVENGALVFPASQVQPVDGVMTTVTLPDGYGVTPFLYVWRVLELVFADLGYEVESNPFKGSAAGDLAKVVLLNNVADALCTGVLKYSDILPDCEVQALLQALYVRFGLVYLLNQDTRRVRLELIRDIITKSPGLDITSAMSEWPTVTYEARKQLKLSAKTSLYNAAPTNERLEDYAKGIQLAGLTTVDERAPGDQISSALLLERATGKLYKWDSTNKAYTDSVSGFFNWDPQTEGVETTELSSEDECVPMLWVDDVYLPGYITGATHRHSYIKGRESEKEENETPLAFVISYGQRGRISPPGDAQGEHLSLLFQWDDGLYARFWSGYDDILRRAFNKVELDARLTMPELLSLDLLQPVTLQGQRLLIDGFNYLLPASRCLEVNITMRTIRPMGDMVEGQTVPPIGPSTQTWRWVYQGDNFDQQLARQLPSVAQQYGGSPTFVRAEGDEGWANDDFFLDPPTESGTVVRDYEGIAVYSVLETDDGSGRPHYIEINWPFQYQAWFEAVFC